MCPLSHEQRMRRKRRGKRGDVAKGTRIRGTAHETHASYGSRAAYVSGSSFLLACLVQWIWEREWKLASKRGRTTNEQVAGANGVPVLPDRTIGARGSTAGAWRPPSEVPRPRGCVVRWSALPPRQRRGSCPL